MSPGGLPQQLFSKFRDHRPQVTKLQSRVHDEFDLKVQSYILAIPSLGQPENIKKKEIKKKAFMVAASHWLDDLVDGMDVPKLFKRLRGWKDEYYGLGWAGSNYTARTERYKEVFKEIYYKPIKNYTYRRFFDDLVEAIDNAAARDENKEYMYFGLNRVALGAIIFSRDVKEREDVLKKHNEAIIDRVKRVERVKGDNDLSEAVCSLLSEMQETDLGRSLIGLTTKTVQEVAMASEEQPLDFPLSVLYGLLYAPLLYFHDKDQEVKEGEISPLHDFEGDYKEIVPWLQKIQGLCKEASDERKEDRMKQIRVAYLCFSESFPEEVKKEFKKAEFKKVYDP